MTYLTRFVEWLMSSSPYEFDTPWFTARIRVRHLPAFLLFEMSLAYATGILFRWYMGWGL